MSCCVKEMKICKGENDERVTDFLTEIELLQSLPTNSHLVEYIGFEKLDGCVRLFMGIYDGSLHDIIKYYKHNSLIFTLQQIYHVCGHVLGALQIMHSRKMMHRDIKSMNVLYEGDIDEYERLYFVIADFGESKLLKSNKTKTIKGTPSWTAPEVLSAGYKGENDYTFSADIWSFGMIIYEMMTLSMPYSSEKFVIGAILRGKIPELNEDHKRRYAPIIPFYEQCLSLKPEDRPTIEMALRRVSVLKDN